MKLFNKKFLASFILISILGIFVFSSYVIGQENDIPIPKLDTEDTCSGTECLFKKAIQSVIGGTLLAIHSIIATGVSWCAGLAKGILNWQGFNHNPMVELGWKIVRDITNIFFVLVLLIIAFATILRIETYGMKALLPKLIIAALLINFSLTIAGIFLDLAGVMTDTFLSSGESDLFTNLPAAMGLQKATIATTADERYIWKCPTTEFTSESRFFCNFICLSTGIPPSTCAETKKEPEIKWGQSWDVFWDVCKGILFSIIFTSIAFIAFALFAILLLIRTIFIWLLLIIAPIAWLLWILPATSKLFQDWWNSFLKWTFFAPIASFFMWLATTVWTKMIEGSLTVKISGAEKAITQMKTVITDESINSHLLPQIIEPSSLLQFLLICGIMIGGLIAALKMGVYGAQGVIGFAKEIGTKASKGAAKWTGRRVQIKTAPIAGKIGQKLGQKLKGVPIARQAGRPFRVIAEKERVALSEEEKRYSNWTSENLKSQYRTVNPRTKAAIARILAKRGDLSPEEKYGFLENDIEEALKIAKKYEQHSEIVKARPDLVPLIKPEKNPEEAIKEQIGKIRPADIEKLQKEAFKDKRVIKAITEHLTEPLGKWRSSHLAKAAEVNPEIFIELKEKVINPNKEQLRSDIKSYLDSYLGKALFEEPEKKIVSAPEENPRERITFP
ncbi:hypothetical protein J7J12_00935 [bacterium]|nr:hypothetical protein [bacterium]